MQTIDEVKEHCRTIGNVKRGRWNDILEVAEIVLRRARQPLPVAEITWRMMSSSRWTLGKAITAKAVDSALYFDIKNGNKRFVKVDKGVFALRKYAKVPRLNLSKARAVWLQLHEGKLPNKCTHRKKGKMSSELKARRRYERHLAENERTGSHAIRGFGTLIMRPINAIAARVTQPSD